MLGDPHVVAGAPVRILVRGGRVHPALPSCTVIRMAGLGHPLDLLCAR